jgi:lipopolysaccharide export system protein LptC
MMAGQRPARSRYDWSARTRTTVFDANRYTKFVRRMKRILPISAFAVIFAVLAFFFVERAPRQLSFTHDGAGGGADDLAMINPRLTGVDEKGNPFVITAKQAVQDPKNARRITLTTIEADMNTEQGWVNARAGRGVVDTSTRQLELAGGIDIYTDSGYMLHTDSASADLRSNVMQGKKRVSGQGPRGTLSADSFRYDRRAGRLTLEGNVRTTILPERK